MEDSCFKIHNLDKHLISTYNYQHTSSVRFSRRKINWIVTIFSYLVELFISFDSSKIYKSQNYLIFKYRKKTIKIILNKFDSEDIENLVKNLRSQTIL